MVGARKGRIMKRVTVEDAIGTIVDCIKENQERLDAFQSKMDAANTNHNNMQMALEIVNKALSARCESLNARVNVLAARLDAAEPSRPYHGGCCNL